MNANKYVYMHQNDGFFDYGPPITKVLEVDLMKKNDGNFDIPSLNLGGFFNSEKILYVRGRTRC